MRAFALAIAIGCACLPAGAETMRKSLVPPPRPAAAAETPAAPAPKLTASGAITLPVPIRPRPRPVGLIVAAPAAPAAETPLAAAPMTPIPRPLPRPAYLAPLPPTMSPVETLASAPAPKKKGGLFGGKKDEPPKSVRGSVCGDPDIRGEKLAPIRSKVQGCGVDEPVRVIAIDGIRLSQAATLDCTTAKALKTWINKGLRPAYGRREVVELKVAGHYICRPRNNKKGAKVSEHGRGKAIDISGIVTSDGRTQMVAGGFDKTMRTAYRAACGIFGTTLGPGSDGYHEDHMHLDTARYNNGAYCR